MAKKDEDKVENETAAVTETSDGPLLDLNDAAVKRMIKLAKKRGFVTYAELNAVLPSEEVSSDQIEDVYAMLSEMGITVSEGDDPDDVIPIGLDRCRFDGAAHQIFDALVCRWRSDRTQLAVANIAQPGREAEPE